MSTVVVGCDENQGNDSEVQNTICKALEKQGHTVEKLDIKPGPFGAYDWGENGKNPKGKIGVYIIADGLTSIADHYDNPGGFKYVYFVIRGDLGRPKMDSRKDFENNPIGKDWHGDCTSKSCGTLAGKSFTQINEIIKSKCLAVFGTNAKEMADELIKAMGGEPTDSASSSKKSSGSTIKEALKQAVSKWDGEVEINLHNDTVYVNKIKDPTTAGLTVDEYGNIIYDSITATDVNPTTINTLVLTYDSYELEMKDETLIKRFDEVKKVIKAPKTVKTLDDAKNYLQREWNKQRRKNGRQVECKVPGSMVWHTGKWVRVFIPSLFIDDYMYITKTSHEEDGTGNWLTGLTLVDYPPSFGAYKESKKDKDKDKDKEEDKEEDKDKDKDSSESTDETSEEDSS